MIQDLPLVTEKWYQLLCGFATPHQLYDFMLVFGKIFPCYIPLLDTVGVVYLLLFISDHQLELTQLTTSVCVFVLIEDITSLLDAIV